MQTRLPWFAAADVQAARLRALKARWLVVKASYQLPAPVPPTGLIRVAAMNTEIACAYQPPPITAATDTGRPRAVYRAARSFLINSYLIKLGLVRSRTHCNDSLRGMRPTEGEGLYRFAVGECVDHVMGGMLAVVQCRSMTAAGIDVYGLVEHDGRPGNLRVMRGPYMDRVEVGSAKCFDCRYWGDVGCTRLLVGERLLEAAE